MAHSYYPMFLDLRGRLAVVIGDGVMAGIRARDFVAAGARVKLITPEVTEEALVELVADGVSDGSSDSRVTHEARRYRPGDLRGASVVFAERLTEEVEQAIYDEAEQLGIPVNIHDRTERCSFIAPAVVRRGELTIAISTAGKAPVLAVRLRQRLEQELGEHHGRFLDLAGKLRAPLLAACPDFEARRQRWYRLIDSDVLELLEEGNESVARQRMAEVMGVAPDGFLEVGRLEVSHG